MQFPMCRRSVFYRFALQAFRRRQVWKIILLVFILPMSVLFLWIYVSCFKGCGPPLHSPGPYISYFQERVMRNNSEIEKLILLWTPKFGHRYWAKSKNFKFMPCRVKTCRFTANKEELDQSDAVMFHSRDLWNNFMGYDLPPLRHPHQVFVYHNLEPPPHVFLNMKAYQGFFNWTANYRQDSDVVTPYGRLAKINDPFISWKTETDSRLRACERTGVCDQTNSNLFKKKTKSIAWTASNCISQGRRQRIVKQLKQLLDVDTYGDCGEKVLLCGKKDFLCEKSLGTYRFYLAFENAVCKDYITEKMWFAMSRGQIPVVYSGLGYSTVLPRNSYISVHDFPSIKHLAEYIKRVNASEELYSSFMWWRKYYKVDADQHTMLFCNLCEALHDKTKPAQVYTDLDGWYRNDSCQQFSVFDLVSRTVEGKLLKGNIIN